MNKSHAKIDATEVTLSIAVLGMTMGVAAGQMRRLGETMERAAQAGDALVRSFKEGE